MGRLIASIFLGLLAVPLVGAITDPVGDVGRSIGGEPVDAPHVDIVLAQGVLNGTTLDLRMQLAGSVRDAPVAAQLLFIFPIAYDLDPDAKVYGEQDATILCTYEDNRISCADTSQNVAVTMSGVDDANVTATVTIPDNIATVAVAGSSAQYEDGNLTAQDFTDNALPYASRPPGNTATNPILTTPENKAWWQNGWLIWIAVVLVGGFVAYRWVNQKP